MNMTHVRRQRQGKGDLDKIFKAGQKAHRIEGAGLAIPYTIHSNVFLT